VPKPRSVHFGVYNVRLLSALDKLLRDKPRYMGELSTSINDALLAAQQSPRNQQVPSATTKSKRLAQGKLVEAILPGGVLSGSKFTLIH
jgi:hypothetical protein